MRTRRKQYSDYGFAEGEAERLIDYCRSEAFTDHDLLIRCAKDSNPAIAEDIYKTIAYKISYYKLAKVKYMIYESDDFYAYRRKTLAIFRDRLTEEGRYNIQ